VGLPRGFFKFLFSYPPLVAVLPSGSKTPFMWSGRFFFLSFRTSFFPFFKTRLFAPENPPFCATHWVSKKAPPPWPLFPFPQRICRACFLGSLALYSPPLYKKQPFFGVVSPTIESFLFWRFRGISMRVISSMAPPPA